MSHRITSVGWLVLFVMLGFAAVALAQDHGDKEKGKGAKFANQAAMAGMAEVKLGELALEKGSIADVKKFAQQMIDDHTKANDELKALAQTKSIELPTDIGKHQKDYDKLAKLSGAEFDREYIDLMVKDHKAVVELFEKEAKLGNDPDTKAWAVKMLPELQSHLQHAQEMQKMMKGK